MEPTVARQVLDRKAQREKLRAFFEAHPDIAWTQATLCEACGADAGALRTRISELKAEHMTLVGVYDDYRDASGVWHRGKKVWRYQPRPAQPLGRDAGADVSGQRELFR